VAKKVIGGIRRSAIIGTFGPGAIVDFRTSGKKGGPVSVVIGGLDQWDKYSKPAGLMHGQSIFHPRLQKRLNVKGFRLPPVTLDDQKRRKIEQGKKRGLSEEEIFTGQLVGRRFPEWQRCPECEKLLHYNECSDNNNLANPTLYCWSCSTPEKPVTVTPVRFVVVCENGHLEDFPWDWWVKHKDGCSKNKPLKLEGNPSAGLAGLKVICTCGGEKSMEGVFSEKALLGRTCYGKRPWLHIDEGSCSKQLRTVQRGASNVYFPNIVSGIDIPPWSGGVARNLGIHWDNIRRAAPEDIVELIRINNLDELTGVSKEKLLNKINLCLDILENEDAETFLFREYQNLVDPEEPDPDEENEFEAYQEEIPEIIDNCVTSLTRATRIREVRVLVNFTRLDSFDPGKKDDEKRLAAISAEPKNWLPAVEVRGEGIFIDLNGKHLKNWEKRNDVIERVSEIILPTPEPAGNGEKQAQGDQLSAQRYMLVHSLAHILIRQLSLECGYSTASLRERLYISGSPYDMAGVLIYTASADADGTLGGLVEMGREKYFGPLLENALKGIEWCSSDPLCIMGVNSASEPRNLAACHSCLLAPELP